MKSYFQDINPIHNLNRISMTSPHNIQIVLPKQKGTNRPEFTPGSISTAGHVSANGAHRAAKILKRSLGTRPTTQYIPIIGNPTQSRRQTGKTMAVSSFQPEVPITEKANLASRKALNKVRLESILPNKPQIQFKLQKRRVLRPVEDSDLTPENLTKLSIDELMDISGIPLGNDMNTSQVKPLRPSLSKSTNTTSQNGTKKTGEKDSVKSFQAPDVDKTMTKKNSEIKRNDGLLVKATVVLKTDGCRHKGLAVPCKLTQNGAETIDNLSESEIETEPTDRAQNTNGTMVLPNHQRFPPRLPPIRLQDDNSSSRDNNTKGEQSRSAALTSLLSSKHMSKNRYDNDKSSIIKKARKQKVEFDRAHVMNKSLISKQDGGKQSAKDEENVSKKQRIFSYNNNGNTDPEGDKGQIYACSRQERNFTLEEGSPNQDPGAPLLLLPPDQLDDMLNTVINMTTGEIARTQTLDPNSTLSGDTKRESTAVWGTGTLPEFNTPNAIADLSNIFPGVKPLPQPPTGFTPDAMNPVDEWPVQFSSASSFSSNATSAFPYLMMKSNVPPPPGLQSMQIPLELPENITSKRRAKSSACLANEKGVVRGAGDEELPRLGQLQSTSEEWDSDDWCYEVRWADGWRETNRDASYLPADVREQLHIDLDRLEGMTPRQPKLVDQPSYINDRTEACQREHAVPHEETSKSNGNNNHKQTVSNCSKGQTSNLGGLNITSPSPNPQREESAVGSSITERLNGCSTNLTSTDQTMTNQQKVSSSYTSDVMISSDSNWSQSTVDWKVDIEELLLLLSGPSDNIQTSESVLASFPSICTEQATLCGGDSTTSGKRSGDDEFSPKCNAELEYHSDPMMCFTLPNGDLEFVDLNSVNEVDFRFDVLTKLEDSLDKYLTECTRTDREVDFFWRQNLTRNENGNLHPTRNNCGASSFLREGRAVHGHCGSSTENSDLQRQKEFDAGQELGHENSAAKSVQDHHAGNIRSRNGVGRMVHNMRTRSLASESRSSTHRLKKSKEPSERSTGLTFPLSDRTTKDSANWQLYESREASIKPDVTESNASARIYQQSRTTPKQIAKELQIRMSASSSDANVHPHRKGTVQHCVEDNMQITYEEGDVKEGVDATKEDNLYTQSDKETKQYPPPINWKPADVENETSQPQEIGPDENCPLPNKEKSMNADDAVSPTIKHRTDVLKGAVMEYYAPAICSPKMTQEKSKVANWKYAPKQRRHTGAYDQPPTEVEVASPSTEHGEDSLKQVVMKVESVTTSCSSESGYIINGTSSGTLSIEEWMRINDEQLDHAIQMERIDGGRRAEQVAPSTNTYQRIVRWLKESDFSLIPPRQKRANQSKKR